MAFAIHINTTNFGGQMVSKKGMNANNSNRSRLCKLEEAANR
jgi:hypothetical protein